MTDVADVVPAVRDRLAVHYSSGKDTWETPNDFFAELDALYKFTLDAAADESNHKCLRFYGPGGEREDALSEAWPINESIWLNPPYSKGAQRRFVDAAVDCAQRGGSVVALLPARTDTRLWHECIWDERVGRPRPWVRSIRFIRGRVRFVGAPSCAPFPSVVVHFA